MLAQPAVGLLIVFGADFIGSRWGSTRSWRCCTGELHRHGQLAALGRLAHQGERAAHFGTPSRTYHFKEYAVRVYGYNLLTRLTIPTQGGF